MNLGVGWDRYGMNGSGDGMGWDGIGVYDMIPKEEAMWLNCFG